MTGGASPILVLGGRGQLGQALVRLLGSRGTPHHAPPRGALDLAEPGAAERALHELRPSAVINAAAFTDVVRCEDPACREEVYRINAELPGRLALACRATGARLVHVSTDYVFDGAKREPYVEEDPVAPLQVYGRSKLAGERAALGGCPGAIVARTSTLFGSGREQRPHYVGAVLRQARERGRLEVVRPPVSSPTYAPDLGWALLELVRAGGEGIVHVANAGACSRLELARAAVEEAGLGGVEIRERPEPAGGLLRPAYSVLDGSRFERWTGRAMRGWREALRAYLAERAG